MAGDASWAAREPAGFADHSGRKHYAEKRKIYGG